MTNKHAQALGRLGGLATKKRGSKYYKRISKLGVEARKKQDIDKNKHDHADSDNN